MNEDIGERVRLGDMRSNAEDPRSTADTMHHTAEALEHSESMLHEGAERSPDERTKRRLHALGDAVTREAKDIDKRADTIAPATARPVDASRRT
jgi:hypothetical protein